MARAARGPGRDSLLPTRRWALAALMAALAAACTGSQHGHPQLDRPPDRHGAATVKLAIRDEAGAPTSARVTLWSDGAPIDPVVMRGGLGWRARRQDFVPGASERSVYVSGDSELAVPPGALRMIVRRGHAFTPVVRAVALEPGATEQVEIELSRWAALDGWRCGDMHLHIARLHPERDGAIRALLDAEDLDVAVLVDWAGRAEGGFAPGWGGWAWTPALLAEESAVDGRSILAGQGWGRPDRACVLAALGHRTPVEGRSRHSAPAIVEHVVSEDGIAIGTMGQVPIEGALLGHVTAAEVLSHGRMELEAWYALLNVGARLAAVAGSDTQGASAPETLVDYHTPPGASRVCVWTDGALGRDAFVSGIAAGRTFVTSGPELELEVDGERPGAVIDGAVIEDRDVRVSIRMRAPVVPGGMLRLIENGAVVWERPADAAIIDVTLERSFERSAWIAARLDGEARIPAGDVAVAHTSPVYVAIDGPVVVPTALEAVRREIADPAAIADSGSSTVHEREVATRWALEARRVLDARARGGEQAGETASFGP